MQVLFDSNALMKEAYVDFERCAQNEHLLLRGLSAEDVAELTDLSIKDIAAIELNNS